MLTKLKSIFSCINKDNSSIFMSVINLLSNPNLCRRERKRSAPRSLLITEINGLLKRIEKTVPWKESVTTKLDLLIFPIQSSTEGNALLLLPISSILFPLTIWSRKLFEAVIEKQKIYFHCWYLQRIWKVYQWSKRGESFSRYLC